MKHSLFFVLFALLLVSCGNGNERLLTSSTGSIYECLIVSNPGIEEAICNTMGGDMYGLPQMEAYFTTTHVTPTQYDDFLKSTRNVLIVDINEHKYTQVKSNPGRDVWAKPQAVVRIQAPSEDAFLRYWNTHGEEVREWFVREELARQIRFYRANTNKDARAKLNKQGYDMLIPEDYVLVMDTLLPGEIEVVWACNNKGPKRRDIVVCSYPYTSQEQFSCDSVVSMRNAVLGQLVTAQVEGSHMGTEYKHFPPVSRQVSALRDTVGGFYGVETRGLWKILDGEAMGGPFVSLSRLDQVNGRVVSAEAFLYAAGQKKRNTLRQMEAILYTLEMPNERQR